MEINKQLFEDVLAGKLKGTFVLKNKQFVKSNTLKRSSNNNFSYALLIKYNNGITDYGTFNSNGHFETFNTSYLDIIDFIPDNTNMKELTIEIPQGKEIDWDESKKQNKIVLKDKQLTYEDVCNALYKDKIVYYTDAKGNISSMPFSELDEDNPYDSNNASTEHQLECILAKNKLANVAKYLNDGWKPIYGTSVWIIVWDCYLGYHAISIQAGSTAFKCYGLVIFKSKELAQQAIEILGEETVKLALEPLGI